MWLVLMIVLNSNAANKLKVLGSNPLGTVFIATYGALFAAQFVCMLVHRFNTFVQYVATLSLAGNLSEANEEARRLASISRLYEIRLEFTLGTGICNFITNDSLLHLVSPIFRRY